MDPTDDRYGKSFQVRLDLPVQDALREVSAARGMVLKDLAGRILTWFVRLGDEPGGFDAQSYIIGQISPQGFGCLLDALRAQATKGLFGGTGKHDPRRLARRAGTKARRRKAGGSG